MAAAGEARRGDIYWIDFGEPRGSEQAGHRPAVVVSTDDLNEVSATVTVAALTTREWRERRPPMHVYLVTRSAAGQTIRSTIKLEQVLTVSIDRLERRLGAVPEDLLDQLDGAIAYALGLGDRM